MSNVTPIRPLSPAEQFGPTARAAMLLRRADKLLTPRDPNALHQDDPAEWQRAAREWLASHYQHPSAAAESASPVMDWEKAWSYERKNGTYVITRDGKVIADVMITDGVPFSAWIAQEFCKILARAAAPDPQVPA